MERPGLKKISFTVVNDLRHDQRMQRICTTLSEEGYEVCLIGRLLPGSAPLPQWNFKTVRLKPFFTKGKLFYIEWQLRLFWFLLFHRPDIYSAVDLDTLLPNLFCARLRGKRPVYDAHEFFTEVPEVVNRPLVKKTWEKLADYAIPKCQAAYTVGSGLAGLFEKKYGLPFSVIRNVPFRQNFQPSPRKQRFVLYQGALNEGRCLEFLIPAMRDLPCELWIAGEGDLSSRLRKMTKELQLEEKVRFLGYVPPEELKMLTPQAFLGFNVLENKGLSYYYSLANKSFDYLQAGIPQLCSPFPEYIALAETHPAFIFAEPGEISIAEAIHTLLLDTSREQEMKAAAGKAAGELTWEKESPRLLNIYAKLN